MPEIFAEKQEPAYPKQAQDRQKKAVFIITLIFRFVAVESNILTLRKAGLVKFIEN